LDLLHEIGLDQIDLRKALPRGLLAETQEIAGMPAVDFDQQQLNQALQKLRNKFASRRIPSFQSGLSTLAYANENMLFRKKPKTQYSFIGGEKDIILQIGKMTAAFPAHLELFFDYILEAPQFSLASFPDYLAYLSNENKLALLRQLISTGLLEQVST
jgi:hypothetical protein